MTDQPLQWWPYFVRAYFSDDVKPPKEPGALCIETIHRSKASMLDEVNAATAREDIGKVEYGER